MDIPCTRCGELGALTYVLHDAPQAFQRTGGRIDHCPAYPQDGEPDLTPSEKARLRAVAALAALAGEDVDGFAADLEDLGLL
jgi:hypothetical protein